MQSQIRINQVRAEHSGSHSSSQKNCVFVEAAQTPYYVMKTLTHCVRVTKKVFAACDYPCISSTTGLLKFNSAAGTRQAFLVNWRKILTNKVEKMRAQSLLSSLMSGASSVARIAALLFEFSAMVIRALELVRDVASKLLLKKVNRWLLDVGLLVADLLTHSTISGTQLVFFLVRIYRLCEQAPVEEMAPQSVLGLLGVISTLGLPTEVLEIFRRFATFTSSRIFEDVTIIHQMVHIIAECFLASIGRIPGAQSIVEGVKSVWEMLAQHHYLLYSANNLVRQWRRNRHIVMESDFRSKVQSLWTKLDDNDALQDWARTSSAVNKRVGDFKSLYRMTLSYENATRMEPVCMAFEGPAGCFKSRYMGLMLKVLGKSVYTHQIKALGDGKDFYDQYDGQELFVMDDLGQGGPSQYRTLFNLVSPIKYPLDCASEKLKDTKFFASEGILFTTNAFMKVSNVTKQDGIADMQALWRRAVVVDFSATARDSSVVGPGALRGHIVIRSYSFATKDFVAGYPGIGNLSDTMQVGDDKKVLAWLCDHYNNMLNNKKSFSRLNDVDDEFLAQIREQCTITAQSDTVSNEFFKYEDETVPTHDEYVDALRFVGQQLGDTDLHKEEILEAFLSHPVLRLELTDGEVGRVHTEVDIKALELELRELKSRNEDRLMAAADRARILRRVEVIRQRTARREDRDSQSSTPWYTRWLKGAMDMAANKHTAATFAVCAMLYITVLYLVNWAGNAMRSQSVSMEKEASLAALRARVQTSTSMNETLAKQVFFCEIIKADKVERCVGLVSGHYVVCPRHAVQGATHISLISRVEGCRLVDHAPVAIVMQLQQEDIAVLKIDGAIMLPFKNISHLLSYTSDCHKGTSLITPLGVIPILGSMAGKVGKTVVKLFDVSHTLDDTNSITYDLTLDGLCGSLLVDNSRGVVGAHVAGNDRLGRALIWTEEARRAIVEVCQNDKFLLPCGVKEASVQSGIKLDLDFKQSTPKKTNFARSPFFGIFGTPGKGFVDMSKPHLVKDLFKKSTGTVTPVVGKHLEFAKTYLHTIVEPFSKITQEEVVRGFESVAPVNMEASTGIGCYKDRAVYFAEGKYTSELSKRIKSLYEQVSTGEILPIDWVAKETIKDEIRAVSKNGEPRTFRILPLPINVLCKELTGAMVNQIVKDRHSHGIMIGINPYVEWDTIHNRLRKYPVIAADIKKFDGNMSAPVQYMVRDVLVEKFNGSAEDKKVLKVVLTSMISNLVAVNDDTYLTTHSMPSGCYLTAIVNSLVHKAYTAMWYASCITDATISGFNKDVEDLVYGDDKLCVVKNHTEFLNAITMRDFFRSIGLDLSTADKKEITQPFDDWDEVNFLKRQFKFHPQLGLVMCPLVDDTLKSMLCFVDTSKDLDEVLQGKVNSFLLESYLRADYYELRNALERELDNNQLGYTMWSTGHIKYMYERREVNSPYNIL